jgi:hypothetical protein
MGKRLNKNRYCPGWYYMLKGIEKTNELKNHLARKYR